MRIKNITFLFDFKWAIQMTFILSLLLFFLVSESVSQENTKKIKKLVKTVSKKTLRVETKASPYKLIGDFNNDKVEDIAVIVELVSPLEKIEKNVKTANPYSPFWGEKVDTKLLALFVIHGKGKGWRFKQKDLILLIGRNSVLIFQKDRLNEKENGMLVEKDENGKSKIIFPTEASEGILKWNGCKYVWSETEP